jgi:vacuolar-type H+-ATPase subunit H
MARGFGKKNEPTPETTGRGPRVIMPGGDPAPQVPTTVTGDPEEALRSIRSRLDTLTGTVSDLVALVGGEGGPAGGPTEGVTPSPGVLDPDVQVAARTLVAAERTASEVTTTAQSEASGIVEEAQRRAAEIVVEADRAAEQRIAERDAASMAERRSWEERRAAIESMLRDLDVRVEQSRASLEAITALVQRSLDEPLLAAPTPAVQPDALPFEPAVDGVAEAEPVIDLRETIDLSAEAPADSASSGAPPAAPEPGSGSGMGPGPTFALSSTEPTPPVGLASTDTMSNRGSRRARRQFFGNPGSD